jgi:hypothetical protein
VKYVAQLRTRCGCVKRIKLTAPVETIMVALKPKGLFTLSPFEGAPTLRFESREFRLVGVERHGKRITVYTYEEQ